MSRAQRERHRGPYTAAVVPRIAVQPVHLPPDVLTEAAEAAQAIVRFDAEFGADAAPFAAVLLRSESASSSQIENLTSGAKQLALAEIGQSAATNAQLIVGNVGAMRAALALADRITPQAVLDMHHALLVGSQPGIAGRWRTEQVWVGGYGYGPHAAEFVPPHHEHVPGLVDDLVAFVRRTDQPVLIQAAIAHAQFETIHPFPDGNGRTGRALVHAMLRGGGLTQNVTVPVSAGLLADTGAYFDTLTAYRAGDPAPIVATLANASFAAITNARRLVADLRAVRAGWDDVIRARRGAGAWALADALIRQPVVDARSVAADLGTSVANTMRAIAPLVDAGVLTEFTGRKRNQLWQAGEVLAALDAFAERAGRRGWQV